MTERPSDTVGPERSPEQVLEHFDFDHDVFRQDTWAEAAPSPEELPDPVERWVEQMKELVAQQAGTIEVLIALDEPMLDSKRPADQYVLERLDQGDSHEVIRTDVQAAYDALETRTAESRFPV